MELPSKLLETIAFNTRPKIEEHMLIVMNDSTHEENLQIPLQTNHRKFIVAVTFLTGYNGIFNITSKNNKFYYLTPTNMLKFVTLPKGIYAVVHETKEDDITSFHTKIKELIIEEGDATESNYPFLIKPNFDNLHSIIEIDNGWEVDLTQDKTIREVLGFKSKIINKEINNSDYPVNIISFDNIFIEADIALGMLINGKRSGIIHNFTMDVDPGNRYIEKFRLGFTWHMMESKDFISNINFKLKNEHNKLVSFNGQSITFRLSIKEV